LDEENLSKAIGRRGQNVRLASKLMDYEINILTEKEESERRQTEFKEKTDNLVKNLELDEILGQLLVAEGYSSIEDIEKGKMTVKKYYHIGVAVDTSHGLMVPKLRNVNIKNINFISEELKTVSEKCRNLKIDKKEFFGGSMTITSLGGIGGSFFTPIINYPEVAILGVGRSSKKNIYYENKYQARIMLPLSLSYDHRIIDGAEAAKFCNELKENLGKDFAYKLAV